MDNQTLYIKTKPSRLFMKAAIPGAISMLASSLYTVFDSMFVGKFLGTTAFAALGLAMPLIVINFALADLVGVGSSVPISIFLGKRKDKEANNYFTAATLLIILTGLLSGILIYIGAPFFMKLMGAEGELLILSVKYTRVYAIFSPLITLNFAMDNFLRICGRIKTSMFLNIFSSFATVLLELLFILSFKWEIEGAALGTCVSMLITVSIGMALFFRKNMQLKYVKPQFSGGMIGQIYKNGISTFLTNIAGRVFSIVMNMMLLKFGGEAAVAVYGVVMTIASIVEQLMYGLIDSLQPAIGYNYGADRIDRVKKIEKYIIITAGVVSIAGGIVMFIFPGQISTHFLEDLSLLDMTILAVRITSLSYLVRWIFSSIQGLFMALEQPFPAMAISICSASVFPLILTAVLLPFKLTGLWWNYTVTAFLTAILALILFKKYKNKLFILQYNDTVNEEESISKL